MAQRSSSSRPAIQSFQLEPLIDRFDQVSAAPQQHLLRVGQRLIKLPPAEFELFTLLLRLQAGQEASRTGLFPFLPRFIPRVALERCGWQPQAIQEHLSRCMGHLNALGCGLALAQVRQYGERRVSGYLLVVGEEAEEG